MATQPIFVHSLFRSASTYFFQKFRSLGSACTCYQEPFNEILTALNDAGRHDRLLGTQEGSVLRHPPLEMPYFHEFWVRRHELAGLYRRAFAYEQYFPDKSGRLPAAQAAYLSALIEQASGRPMLQFCRSSGRIGAMRHAFGGVHIHVWREPRNQWWSYKVAGYFDRVTQSIYHCRQLPSALRSIRNLAGIDSKQIYLLPPRDNYVAFYGLWLDAWLRLRSQAELSISMDGIATSSVENVESSRRLSELTGHALDLSDVRSSGMVFTAEEQGFYSEVEAAVNQLFVRSGAATWQQVQAAGEAARAARHSYEQLEHDPAVERNLRQASVAMMEQLAGLECVGTRLRTTQFNPRLLRDYGRLLTLPWSRLMRARRGASNESSRACGPDAADDARLAAQPEVDTRSLVPVNRSPLL